MFYRPHKTGAGRLRVWLAMLAVAIQVLLPYLVAHEIALASDPANPEISAFCLAFHPTGTPPNHGGQTDHPGPAGACPICTAIAVGQSFTAPPAIAVQMPRPTPDGVVRDAASTPRIAAFASAPYSPRAPPSTT